MQRHIVVGILAAMLVLASVSEGRYLPTRGQDDKLLRLRQLLKDFQESHKMKSLMKAGVTRPKNSARMDTAGLLENDVDPMEHQMSAYDPRLYKREAIAYERPVQYIH